nr:uncharacterized protein LOC111776164 [Equus caballus]
MVTVGGVGSAGDGEGSGCRDQHIQKPLLSGWPGRVGPTACGGKGSPVQNLDGAWEKSRQMGPAGVRPQPVSATALWQWGYCLSDSQHLWDVSCPLCALALSESRLPGDSGSAEPWPIFSGSWPARGQPAWRRWRLGLVVTRGSGTGQPGSALQPPNSWTLASFSPRAVGGRPPAKVLLSRVAGREPRGLQSVWPPRPPGHQLLAPSGWEAGWARADLGRWTPVWAAEMGCLLACAHMRGTGLVGCQAGPLGGRGPSGNLAGTSPHAAFRDAIAQVDERSVPPPVQGPFDGILAERRDHSPAPRQCISSRQLAPPASRRRPAGTLWPRLRALAPPPSGSALPGAPAPLPLSAPSTRLAPPPRQRLRPHVPRLVSAVWFGLAFSAPPHVPAPPRAPGPAPQSQFRPTSRPRPHACGPAPALRHAPRPWRAPRSGPAPRLRPRPAPGPAPALPGGAGGGAPAWACASGPAPRSGKRSRLLPPPQDRPESGRTASPGPGQGERRPASAAPRGLPRARLRAAAPPPRWGPPRAAPPPRPARRAAAERMGRAVPRRSGSRARGPAAARG